MRSRSLIPHGTRFGRWTVGKQAPHLNGKTNWFVTCDCGVSNEILGSILRAGKSQSCGCLKAELQLKHGRTGTKIYKVWNNMVQRTTNPEYAFWEDYGGRGITLDKRWLDIEVFIQDMGEDPKGLQLDRIDNDKGYSKENCRWVTRTQNGRNKRNNIFVCYEGRSITLSEASELTGIRAETLGRRQKKGLTNKELFKPTF